MYNTIMMEAKFVREIVVIDPDSHGEVELAVFKHPQGGMFALDSSYIDQVLPELDEGDCIVPDPFVDEENVQPDCLIKLIGV